MRTVLERPSAERPARTDASRQDAELLFHESPPRPYAEVARRQGLATGSVGFIRSRCLKRLEQISEELGF